MSPPRWFWFVVAFCVLLLSIAYAWNVWHDNQPKVQAKTFSQMTDVERREHIRKKQEDIKSRRTTF